MALTQLDPKPLTIITNNHFRPLLDWNDLSETERTEFDYLTEMDKLYGAPRFFRYRGRVYDSYEFTAPPLKLYRWDAIHSDSFFSGILYRYDADCENVIVGRFYC